MSDPELERVFQRMADRALALKLLWVMPRLVEVARRSFCKWKHDQRGPDATWRGQCKTCRKLAAAKYQAKKKRKIILAEFHRLGKELSKPC